MRKVGRFMRSKAAVTAMILSTAILAGGCGEDAQAASDIAPTEPTSQTAQETTEAEANVSKAEAETESIIEDTTIDEAEAKKMLKEYSDQIAEADIEDYNEDLVYVFMTNYNEGKSTDESFTQALQHVKDLKAFDEETKAQQQAQYDAEAREAEANKQAEAQTKQETKQSSNTEEVKNSGSDGSVPLTAEESKAVEQVPQTPAPAPAPQTPAPAPQTPAPAPSGEKELTEAEKQAIADKENERISQITDPNHPEYGGHYVPTRGIKW